MLRKAHCMSQCVTHSFSASIILSAVFWSTTCTNANPLQHAVSGNAGKGTQWSDGRTGTASLRGREQDGRPGSPRASQTVGAHRPCSSAHTRKQIGQLRSIPTAHTRSSYVEREVACSSEHIINVISCERGTTWPAASTTYQHATLPPRRCCQQQQSPPGGEQASGCHPRVGNEIRPQRTTPPIHTNTNAPAAPAATTAAAAAAASAIGCRRGVGRLRLVFALR